MKKTLLGQTGLEVSALGLGSVKFGRNTGVKYPQTFALPSKDQISNLLALAKDLGINLLDTAPAYGSSEKRLGELLKNRQDWIIVSKVGEKYEKNQSVFDFSAKATRKTIQESLKNLHTDYLDVVLIHSDGEDLHIAKHEEAGDTLQQMKQEGLIRAWGMSSKTTAGGMWVVEHCDVIMATRNQQMHHDDSVLDQALRLNKGVLIKKGLESGHVAAKSGGGGVYQAMEYVFSHPSVHCLITGTVNPEHLQENADIVNQILDK